MLNEFKQTAIKFASAKANATQAKSLANQLIGEAIYITKDGTLQERVSLARYVAKDNEGYNFRQYVSKAKSIVEFFAAPDAVITLKDGGEVTQATINQGSFDALPSVTFTSVYNAINALTKGEKHDVSREKQALALGMETEGLSKDDVKALSQADKARLMQVGEAILAANDAKAHLDSLAGIKHAIEAMTSQEREALVSFIQSLDAVASQAA